MAPRRYFAYDNSGSTVPSATRVGNLLMSTADLDYYNNYGGLKWWPGPDEDLGWVITHQVPSGDQPSEGGENAFLGFWRSKGFSNPSFIALAEYVSRKNGTPQTFADANDAKTWLESNGYYTNEGDPLPSFTPTPTSTVTPTASSIPFTGITPTETTTVTPTPTATETQIAETPTPTATETQAAETPTPTPTATETQIAETPTPTPTPTATDLSTITTYTISGCTNLNTLVIDLGPGFIVPGDVFYFTFSGGTPEGCYSVVGKINAPIEDAYLSSFGYGNCNDCEVANVTPTPTPTATETQPPPTPNETETPTPTPTATETQAAETPTPTPTATETQAAETPTPTPTATETQAAETPTPTPTATETQPQPTPNETETPTPTPTATETQPPPTPNETETPTPTPTATETLVYCNYVSIDSSTSLDITISGVTVDSVNLSYVSGKNFPISNVDDSGFFGTYISGGSVTVRVYYGPCTGGQNITVTDSTETTYCCDINSAGGYCEFTVNLSCGTIWSIIASDGVCPP